MKMLLLLLMIVVIVAAPIGALAQTEHEDMDMEAQPQIPAGRPSDPDYKPQEKAADNSGMAAIAAGVFGTPIVLWLVVRSARKPKRPT